MIGDGLFDVFFIVSQFVNNIFVNPTFYGMKNCRVSTGVGHYDPPPISCKNKVTEAYKALIKGSLVILSPSL